jgi:UDP-N-acetyl-D-mannosaminuronic acid dehydrogenase
MLKLIDNTFRDVIFAYSNQMALICDKLGLDIHKIISTANRDYKRSFIPSPSPGVGGACLSKDPHILIDLCKKLGITYKLIQSGRFINEYIPFYLANKIKGGKVFIMGFAFKGDPETSDVRFSPTGELIKYLGDCEIYGYDPLVNLGGRIKSCTIEQGFSDADYVIIMTNHKSFKTLDYPKLMATAKKDCVLIDWWRMYDTLE